MSIREQAKKTYYFYQRFFWYVGQGAGEANKPLTGFDKLTYATLLLKTFFVTIPWQWFMAAWIFVLTIMFLWGWFHVKTGAVKMVNGMSNEQSHELMEILRIAKNIEDKINK